LYDIGYSQDSVSEVDRAAEWHEAREGLETALQQDWFRRLTTWGAVVAAGFTALLAGLGLWLAVRLLLIGAVFVGAVFLVTLIALALARAGRLRLGAQILAGAGVAHAIAQSYLFPFAAPVLAVSAVLSVASVLPYVHGRPLRWLVASTVLASLAIATLPRISPFGDVVPPAAQQLIEMAALPAVTILTALLLLQFSERSRHAHQAESAAHLETEQTRGALERASQRLAVALSAAGIGFWDLDLSTGMVILDDSCKSTFGLAGAAGAEYTALLQLVLPEDRERVDVTVRSAVRSEGDGRYELEYRMRDPTTGATRWIRSTGQLLRDGDQPVRLIGTAQDVTASKSSEIDLRRAKELAEDANRAKDEFLAMLGHELRNPLAPMLTALELLRLRLGEAGARERGVIHRQVRNLAQLVDDMLDVARIRKGRLTIARESLYARQVVAQALETVTPMLEERRHHLEVDIEPPALVVVGDERRLVQAVTNLLTNAVKYTEPGGAIRVAVSDDGAFTTLSVRDTGKGISAALLPRVFEPFVQGERTPDRREGGLGLGLPIVRSIVERHGGTVSASSGGVGRGSEFVIRLPGSGIDTPLPSVRPVTAADEVAASNPRILIIDDNRDATDSLHALLRDHGFSCASALDGPSGLQAVETFAPDVVLLDIGLPGLDGYAVARRIRSSTDGNRCLIVALTGYGQERDRERSMQAGIDAHLVKPVELEQLLTVIRTTSRAFESTTRRSAVAGRSSRDGATTTS